MASGGAGVEASGGAGGEQKKIVLGDLSEYMYKRDLGDLEVGKTYKLDKTLVSVVSIDGVKLILKRFNGEPFPYDPSLDTSLTFYSKTPFTLLELVNVKELTSDVTSEAIRQIEAATNADINLTNSEGKTALMIALERGHGVVAAALIAKGANLAITSHEGKNAYTYFCKNNTEEFIWSKNIEKMFKARGYGSSCTLQGGRRSQRTKKARQTRRQRAKKNRKSRRTTRK